MRRTRFLLSFGLALALGATGCSSDAKFYYGESLAGLKLALSTFG